MKVPESPPSLENFLSEATQAQDMERLASIASVLVASGVKPFDSQGRYLHWERLKHLDPPAGLTAEQHWFAVQLARQKLHQDLPFSDKGGTGLSTARPAASSMTFSGLVSRPRVQWPPTPRSLTRKRGTPT